MRRDDHQPTFETEDAAEEVIESLDFLFACQTTEGVRSQAGPTSHSPEKENGNANRHLLVRIKAESIR